jgi:hypothetical protein
MSATISLAALVLVLATAGTQEAAPKQSASTLTVPQAATAQAALDKEKDSMFQVIRWRRSAQAFATWGGPWLARPGQLYDERYVTW